MSRFYKNRLTHLTDACAIRLPQFSLQRIVFGRGKLLLLVVLSVCAVLLGFAYRGEAETVVPTAGAGLQQGGQTAAVPPLDKLPGLPSDPKEAATGSIPPPDALARNAAVPFVSDAVKPAQPFRFTGTMLDRQRAIDCLALAAMAEAGGSDAGQRAVMQVVLNRVRHPAFAKTICGVVFQGAERATGCQFTFTCDGSLARQYGEALWQAARKRAAAAMDGYVFGKVGTATHYHTDWVYPYWSPSLDKIAKVDTHLFFRWKGYWGTPASFRAPYRGGEAALVQAVSRAQGAIPQPATDSGLMPVGVPGQRVTGASRVVRHPEGGAYLLTYAGLPTAQQALTGARHLCGGKGYCRVMGWTDQTMMPRGFPVSPAARAGLSFNYVIDAQNNEIVYYDCRIFKGIERDKCIPAPVRPT